MRSPLRIAFLGLPLAAVLLAADGHRVVYAGLCRRGAPGARRLRALAGAERVQVMPDLADPAVQAAIRDARPDLLVSWFWTRRVPAALLEVAPLGTVGVHPSLLPRHRGPDPIFHTLLAGDELAGVTAHRLEREYDTGAILGQRSLRVDPAWDAWTLARKLDRPSLALLRAVVGDVARGASPMERRQDEAAATLAPSPDDDALHLDPRRRSAAELERLVRAAAPYPGAFMDIEGEIVVVTRAALEPGVPPALVPGEAHVVNGRAVVRATDTGLALLRGRLVGEEGAGEGEIDLDEEGLASLVARLSRRAGLA